MLLPSQLGLWGPCLLLLLAWSWAPCGSAFRTPTSSSASPSKRVRTETSALGEKRQRRPHAAPTEALLLEASESDWAAASDEEEEAEAAWSQRGSSFSAPGGEEEEAEVGWYQRGSAISAPAGEEEEAEVGWYQRGSALSAPGGEEEEAEVGWYQRGSALSAPGGEDERAEPASLQRGNSLSAAGGEENGAKEVLDQTEKVAAMAQASVCLYTHWNDMGGNKKFRSITCRDNEELFKGCCFLKCSDLMGWPGSQRISDNQCSGREGRIHVGFKSLRDYPCGVFGRSADGRCCSRRRECLEKAGGTGEVDANKDAKGNPLSLTMRLREHCMLSCGKFWPGSSRLEGTSFCGRRCRAAAPEGKVCVHNRFRRGGQSSQTFVLRGSPQGVGKVIELLPSAPHVCFARGELTGEHGLQVWRRAKTRADTIVSGPNITWEGDSRSRWDVVLGRPRIGDEPLLNSVTEDQKYSMLWVQRPPLAHSSFHADWMGKVLSDAPQLRLRDLCIPGSHDSGTYYLSQSYRRLGDRFAGLLTKITQTQDLTIMEQLSIGIRYFDFRVQSWRFSSPVQSADFYLHHGGIRAVPLSQALNEIDTFLADHPREVVILDFQQLPSQPKAQGVLRQVFEMFATAVPVSEGFDLTIGRMWELKANLLLLWSKEDAESMGKQEGTESLWGWSKVAGGNGRRDGAVDSAWGRTLSARDLYNHVFSEVKRPERENTFHVSQMILTPVPGELRWASVRRGLSIRELQDDLDLPSLVYQAEALARRHNGRGVNVVMADFVQEHQLADVCIDLNLRHVQDAVAEKEK